MRALCERLGNPERDFRSLHVVGTNGKSSVTLMSAALLEAAGVRTGACVSPHLRRWAERTRIAGREIDESLFAAALGEVAEAIESLERQLDAGERITQFEAAIAASLVAFRRAEIEVAVIEAGLGGRLDATNVIASEATALTSVGLDHTEWLGETLAEIATEKLAVLEPGSTLVLGELPAEIHSLAREHARRLEAEVIEPQPIAPELLEHAALPAAAAAPLYPRANAAIALELARIGSRGPIDPGLAARTLASLALPGRLELIDADPPLVLDAAHNPQGAAALARDLGAMLGRREVIGCVSVLADKDLDGIAAALAPALRTAVATAAEPGPAMGRPGARAADPSRLAAAFERAGTSAETIPEPREALARARGLAAERDGVALAAGSHYLLRYAWTERHDQSCSR